MRVGFTLLKSGHSVALGLRRYHRLSRNSNLMNAFFGQFMVAVYLFHAFFNTWDLLKSYIITIIELPPISYYDPLDSYTSHIINNAP